MHLNLLALKDNKIGADERLVLCRFLDEFGSCGARAQHLEKLLEELQLPYKLGSRAFRELVQKRILIKEAAPKTGRGRPTSSYRPSEGLLVDLDHQKRPSLRHHDRITAVLWTEIRGRARPASKPGKAPNTSGMTKALSPKDLWFLAVLLAHADDRGVIANLSRATLIDLTGMNLGRLAFRLQKLEKLRIIISMAPGAKSEHLSSDMNAFIRLNLAAPTFGSPYQLAARIHVYAPDGQTAGSESMRAPPMESLPLTPFSMTRFSHLQQIMGELQAAEREALFSQDTDASNLEYQEDALNLEQAETREQMESMEPALTNARRFPTWEKQLESYFLDFSKRNVLEWFRARIFLYSSLMVEAEWNTKCSGDAEYSVSLDRPTMPLIQRDFSLPKGSPKDLEPLHSYIHALALALADYLKLIIKTLRPQSPELRIALDEGAIAITITTSEIQALRGQELSTIHIWRTKKSEEASSKPIQILYMDGDKSTDLPNIRWLQRALPEPLLRSDRPDWEK